MLCEQVKNDPLWYLQFHLYRLWQPSLSYSDLCLQMQDWMEEIKVWEQTLVETLFIEIYGLFLNFFFASFLLIDEKMTSLTSLMVLLVV